MKSIKLSVASFCNFAVSALFYLLKQYMGSEGQLRPEIYYYDSCIIYI